MTHTAMPEMINLADGIEARLNKSLAMLSVIRSTDTSTYNEQEMHDYFQTIPDLVEEAHSMHCTLWQEIAKSQKENMA